MLTWRSPFAGVSLRLAFRQRPLGRPTFCRLGESDAGRDTGQHPPRQGNRDGLVSGYARFRGAIIVRVWVRDILHHITMWFLSKSSDYDRHRTVAE